MSNYNPPALKRHTFTTSRLLEFTSQKELALQTGQPVELWPLVILKELPDNSLDACEEAGIAPELVLTIDSARGLITVADNGPGIPPETVASILDFTTRTSSREAYVSPTRGAQGNALKTVLAMPFACGNGEDAITTIEAHAIRHTIGLSVDTVRQQPVVTHEQQSIRKKLGTIVTVQWPLATAAEWPAQKRRFLQFLLGYILLNPHVDMTVAFDRERLHWKALNSDWSKWAPHQPTSPHWYDRARFGRLLAAYAHQNGDRTVREFVTEFRGLSGSAKVSDVLDATGLHRVTIGDLFDQHGKPSPHIAKLLAAMQLRTGNIKPADLGVIGQDNFRTRFVQLGGDPDSFTYKRALIDGDIPAVIEVAFAYAPELAGRVLFTGVNFSPAIINPFRQLGAGGEGLERVLAGQRVESGDEIIVAVHLTAPHIDYLDRGKASIALGGGERDSEEEQENPDYYLNEVEVFDADSLAGQLVAAVKTVTKGWLKQRKAEDRDHKARANRAAAMTRARRASQKSVAFDVMDSAYLAASAGGTLTANARQIMYAARPEIQHVTGKQLRDTYFTQTLLPDYIAKYKPSWKDQVAYDDRGHFSEPHTDITIGLGTVAVRNYLDEMGKPELVADFDAKVKTCGPSGRFVGVFFVEKEGFDALFEQVQLARRYDLAFMSCKGISVTAARKLADQMCAEYDIPLYLLTDFDKSGFSGAGTFEHDNRRYTYKNDIKVIRLGLRLDDVRAIATARGVELTDFTEAVFDKGNAEARRRNLIKNGATEEEAEFLLERRVELNALRSDELVDFIERKLQKHGVRKLIPPRNDLAAAYRLFKRGVAIRKLVETELAKPDSIRVPANLDKQVRAYLADHSDVPWDDAVARIAGWTKH